MSLANGAGLGAQALFPSFFLYKMKVKDFRVYPCKRSDIKSFVEKYHYSRSINGVNSKYCFGLYDGHYLIGAAIFGNLGMAHVWKTYADSPKDIIELRRLCCIDDTPKNTESFFIGRCLKWLKRNTKIKKVISYADPEQGHEGTIYKATGFEYIGQGAVDRVIVMGDKQWHPKTIRTYYKGELKPFAKKLKQALDEGKAVYKKVEGKYIYIKEL